MVPTGDPLRDPPPGDKKFQVSKMSIYCYKIETQKKGSLNDIKKKWGSKKDDYQPKISGQKNSSLLDIKGKETQMGPYRGPFNHGWLIVDKYLPHVSIYSLF